MGRRKNSRKTTVRLDHLIVDPRRFQNRSLVAGGYSEYGKAKGRSWKQIKELVAVIKATDEPLDPVVVWEDTSTGQYHLVDGFHRYEAYRQAMRDKAWRKDRQIPCRIVQGDIEEVILEVYRENQKGKLGFDQEQRMEFAWRQLWAGQWDGLTVRTVSRRYTISVGMVSKMQNAARKQFPKHVEPEPPCLWEEARKGEEEDQEEPQETDVDELAEGLADSLGRAFERSGHDPEVLQAALRKAIDREINDIAEVKSQLKVDVVSVAEEDSENDY